MKLNLFHDHQNLFLAILMLASLAFSACTCLTCGEDGEMMQPNTLAWDSTDVYITDQIIGLHCTSDELLVFSKNEFVRVNRTSENVIERRQFLRRDQAVGQPAINDLVFARGVVDTRNGSEAIQFQLIQNHSELRQFYIDSLTSELLAIESNGAQIGAFNASGTVYVQPVIQRTNRRLGMLIFSLSYDQSITEFTECTFAGLIDFPEVRESSRVVSSIRFIDNHFYISTKFGAYRMSESGLVELIIESSTDVRDIFKYNDTFYATQVSLSPMFMSDNGSDWQSSGIVSDLRLVDVFDNQLISQEFEGWQYRLTNDIMQVTDPLKLNRYMGLYSNDEFFGIDKQGSTFYIGYKNKLYKSDSLRAVL